MEVAGEELRLDAGAELQPGAYFGSAAGEPNLAGGQSLHLNRPLLLHHSRSSLDDFDLAIQARLQCQSTTKLMQISRTG